jgi:hypothetical protein
MQYVHLDRRHSESNVSCFLFDAICTLTSGNFEIHCNIVEDIFVFKFVLHPYRQFYFAFEQKHVFLGLKNYSPTSGTRRSAVPGHRRKFVVASCASVDQTVGNVMLRG